MAVAPDAQVDPVVFQLRLLLGTVLPVFIVVTALVSSLRKDRGYFADIVSDEDVQEEIAREKAIRSASLPQEEQPTSSETSPLMDKPPSAGRRSKNFTYAAIGTFELAMNLVHLLLGERRTSFFLAHIPGLIVWTYATVMPLVSQPVSPPISLFFIYLCTLGQSALDIFLASIDGTDILRFSAQHILSIVHVAANLVGTILILNTRLQPRSDMPEVSENGSLPAMDDFATVGQYMTVSWMQPLLDRARTGAIEDKDIPKIASSNKASLLTRKFLPFMPHSKLLRRVMFANWGSMVMFTITQVVGGVLICVQPILLRRILLSIEGAPPQEQPVLYRAQSTQLGLLALAISPEEVVVRDNRSAYLFAAIAFALLVIRAQLSVLNQVFDRRITVRSRGATIGAIYAKALVRIDTAGITDAKDTEASEESANRADMGKLVSLVSVDVNRLGYITTVISCALETPLNIIISGWFLYSILGYSAFVGYVTFFAIGPITAWITNKMILQLRVVGKARDKRTRAVNELLQSIKFIKFSGWETKWSSRVHQVRNAELKEIFKQQVIQAMFSLIWKIVPIFIACINLTWFTAVLGNQLTVAIAFPAILALDQLTAEMNSAPAGLSFYGMIVAALGRIDEFLEEDEVPSWMSAMKSGEVLRSQQFDTRLGAANANFQWYKTSQTKADDAAAAAKKAGPAIKPWYRRSPLSWFKKSQPIQLPTDTDESPAVVQQEEATFQLRDINVLFPRGKLSIVTGATGSGKSSLLAALLGEMECLSGKVLLPKTSHRVDPETGLVEGISFCSQHPWLESKTIRDNILFGSPFDEQRYKTVLDACVLQADLKQLDDGDATEIGDKGIILSGGQKARVALARAVYARTQTVLLDDVLSAVDTHTAAALIKNCFLGPIMNGRTLVLVTHHFASIASNAAWIVKMDNGAIVSQGSPDDLRASGQLAEIAKSEANAEKQQAKAAPEPDKVENEEAKTPKKLVEAETKARGSVRLSVYSGYFKAASYWVLAVFAFGLVLEELGYLGEKIWVKVWSESYDQPPEWRNFLGFPSASIQIIPYVAVYLGLQLGTALLIIGAIFPSIWSTLRASRTLFTNMLESVLRSPTRFFDKTPTGRILNRFSKDIDGVDGNIQDYMQRAGGALIGFVVQVATVTYGIPPFIVPLVFLTWLHLYVARGYVTASRDMVRLNSTTRSPLITQFGEILHGLTTIRAFNGEARYMESMYILVDRFQAAFYYDVVADIWLRYRFDVLGAITFGLSAMLTLYLGVTPGLAAIILTQAQNIIHNIYYGLLVYVMVENSMNGVERIEEYIALPAEPPRHVPDTPAAWPILDAGITFDDVVLRYAPELDPVLRGVSFHVSAGQKVGIVGRTGSGKSTLAMSLFRFADPDSGRISVAGLDITQVGVQDLREKLTLIPQDAVLYNGTIRDNLDPFSEHTDAACLDALRMVQLPIDAADGGIPIPAAQRDEVEGEASNSASASGAATPAQTIVTLESKVSEGGANWSAGQRQLIAMARALLRNTGIIVLDESTASVDFETDKKIQTTIREHFKGAILLTIAHRLNTIIDYDRVLVLDHGKVVEYDTPAHLIRKKDGVFRGMCQQSGHFDELVRATEGTVV